ncbi:MAG: energy transducer TonB, partial [Gemmatimonadaceae bacterium]
SVANRKRGGATISVLVHAALIVGTFAAASAAPVPDERRETQTPVYVPPPTPPPALPRNATPTSTDGAADASARTPEPVLRILDLTTITIDIPTVSTELTIDPIDLSARDFRRSRTAGTGHGSGSGGGVSETHTGDIFRDLQVDKQVVALSGYRTPRYPESMRATGVEATITAQFVVDTLGRIESNSLEFQDVQHPQFFPAVRDALANARFRPAEANGRRVRQLVMQSFVFSLNRD